MEFLLYDVYRDEQAMMSICLFSKQVNNTSVNLPESQNVVSEQTENTVNAQQFDPLDVVVGSAKSLIPQ